MRITPGTRVGPYEVVSALGAGGMGEVYRARDARLGRDVALKILPEVFVTDAERLARFEREAQVLASVNHPRIGAIYGVEQAPGTHALVLELVEGETLADRIGQGPLPVDDAVQIAVQIAEALEAAHQHGIVHRDLKPANVKLTPAGSVKVLDFGLAKLTAVERSDTGSGARNLSMSPTLTSPAGMTGVGMLLGTAAYMAPEQARGRAVDRRADIWALGCVLFEMLAGRRPFDGSDATEILATVIKGEPPWNALPGATPPRVHRVLRKCLEKDPEQRLRDCGDFRLALEGAFDVPAPPPPSAPRRRGIALIAAAALVAAAVTGAAVWLLTRTGPPDPPRPVQFALFPPEGTRFAQYFSVSPDGAQVAFTAADSTGAIGLWVYSLRTGESRPIQSAGTFNNPMFWSPDGRFVAYTSLGRLMRVDVGGGPPETIVPNIVGFEGGAWNRDGTIVYSAQGGVFKVAAAGGTPTAITRVDSAGGETAHAHPWFLPDGQHFLYLRSFADPARSGIYIGSIEAAPDAQPLERVLATTAAAVYGPGVNAESGVLLFARDTTAMTVGFDATTRQVVGDPRRLADGLGVQTTYPFLSASSAGTIAYRIGGAPGGGRPVWVDRSGRALGALADTVRNASFPRISPDGSRVAVVIDGDVWVYPVDNRPPVRVTFEGGVFTPLWTRDGQRVVYERATGGLGVMYADGRGGKPETPFVEGHLHPLGWSPDGTRVIAAIYGIPETGVDLVHVPLGGGAPEPIVVTPGGDASAGATLSPDGRWLAYHSGVTGTAEIWVRPYATDGPAVRISPNTGSEPVWAPNGRELYYVERNKLMAVKVDTSAGFRAAAPTLLFDGFVRDSQPPSYDIAPDGRFLVKRTEGEVAPSPLTIVVNWSPPAEQ